MENRKTKTPNRKQYDGDMSAGQRGVTEVQCSGTGGSLRHTQDLS